MRQLVYIVTIAHWVAHKAVRPITKILNIKDELCTVSITKIVQQ